MDNDNGNVRIDTTHELEVRRAKLTELKERGQDPYAVVKFDRNTLIRDIKERFDELEGAHVVIAGRMMSRRDMGKANFIDLSDSSGRLQIYARLDDIGEETWTEFKKWDIGDIIGVGGTVFRTRRGEISVHADSVKLLSKSLIPLPEKWHGLKDQDTRYRRRYVDLIVNPEVKGVFEKRSAIISEIRSISSMRWDILRWTHRYSIRLKSVPRRGLSKHTTTRSISICICVLKLSFISND